MISLRPADESDTAVIAAIFRDSRRVAMPWLPRLHTPEEDLFFFESSVMKNCQVLIAQEDEAILGFCAVRDDWIDHFYLRPDRLRLGTGTRLLDQTKTGRPRLQLWAFQRNVPARRFYEARGFRPVELTDGALNEEKEPDVRYLWTARAGEGARAS